MGGNIPTGYIDVGPSASEAAGFNPAGGGNQSAAVATQLPKASGSKIKVGNMPGGGVGSGYVKTGAPAYNQSGFLAGEIPPDGSFSGPFQVTQAPALQAAPEFSYAGSRRRR